MAQNEPPEEQISEESRRENVADWTGLLGLVGVLCVAFVLLVAAGYGARALFRMFF